MKVYIPFQTNQTSNLESKMSAESFQSFPRMIHPRSLSAKSSGAPDMIQMKKYEMIPGSLKRAISEKSLNRSIVVQVQIGKYVSLSHSFCYSRFLVLNQALYRYQMISTLSFIV